VQIRPDEGNHLESTPLLAFCALDGAAAPSKPKMLFEHSLFLIIVGRHA